MFNCHAASGQSQLSLTGQPMRLAIIPKVITQIKIFDFAGNFYRKISSIKKRNRADTALAVDQRFPVGIQSYAVGGDNTHTCDNYPVLCIHFNSSL